MLGAGKYHDYVIGHSKKSTKVKICILGFYCDFCFQDDRVELSKEFDQTSFF
jgi:hypothetical protein